MNKRIDLTKLGGYPLAQEDLDFMQSSYRSAMAALADLIGDKVIISGMVEGGGAVTAGWIAIGGELVPFEAGAIGTGEFIIDELITPLVFEDGVSKDVLYTRIAKFSAGGPYSYADLTRIEVLKSGLVPKGLISMWSGDVAEIPDGWALCDGTAGTPNLSGRFIVGYDAGDVDYDGIGDTGGFKSVAITGNQLPSKQLNLRKSGGGNYYNDDGGGGGLTSLKGDSDNSGANGTIKTDPLGNDEPHENRPPYYVLAYIIKL